MPFQMIEPPWTEANVQAVGEFLRRPDIYWPAADSLAPQPEQMSFVQHLTHSDVSTFVASFDGEIVGYVQFNRRTSIGAEIHCAFVEVFNSGRLKIQVRGTVAKKLGQYAIACAFQKGLLKLWAPIPADNRAAIFAARHLGFRHEGTLTRAIVREAGIMDLVIYGLTKEQFLARSAGAARHVNGKAS